MTTHFFCAGCMTWCREGERMKKSKTNNSLMQQKCFELVEVLFGEFISLALFISFCVCVVLLCSLTFLFLSPPEKRRTRDIPPLDVISLLFVCFSFRLVSHKNVIYLSPQHHTLNRSNELHSSAFIPPKNEIMTENFQKPLSDFKHSRCMWCNKKQPKSLHTHTADEVEPLFFAPRGWKEEKRFSTNSQRD